MEKHLQYNICSLVIWLIHAGFYQPLWHYKVRSLNLICPVYQEIIGIKKAPVTRHCIKRRRRTDRIFLCMSQGRTCLFCCEKSVAIPKNTIPRSAKTDRKIEYHVRIGESDSSWQALPGSLNQCAFCEQGELKPSCWLQFVSRTAFFIMLCGVA